GAATALTDTQHIDRVVRSNDAQRALFCSEMNNRGFECIPSQANFVMVNIRTDVEPVINEFSRKKILVGRPFPPMTKFLRVTIGPDDEMKRFSTAFRQIL